MTEPREIEAKFEIDDPTPLRELKKAPPLTVVSAEEIIQVDTYLDTPDGALHQAGSTLRLRESSGRWTLTYKGKRAPSTIGHAHIASRVEVSEPVTAQVAASILAGQRTETRLPPMTLAGTATGDASLVPVARIENHRTAIGLLDEAGRAYELAVDDCRGERLSDGRVVAFSEVELEARTADHDDLLRAVDALRAAIPTLRPSGQSKLARVLSQATGDWISH